MPVHVKSKSSTPKLPRKRKRKRKKKSKNKSYETEHSFESIGSTESTDSVQSRHSTEPTEETESHNEQSTFERQMCKSTAYQNRKTVISTETAARQSLSLQRNSYLSQLKEAQAQAEVFSKLQSMQQKGSTVLSTLTKAFGPKTSNWHTEGKPKDVKQILAEAEGDQKYKKLHRNSRIIIQITRETAAVLPRTIIHPETEWRSWWDMFMLLLVSYYAVVTPINIAFDKSPFNILALEIIFNTFFVIDIVLQFFTSYKITTGPNAGRLEVSHSRIITNYLTGWFLIDVLASFPIDIILAAATGQKSGNTLNRLLRLVRSVKLMRILRMSRIWKRLLVRARLNPSVVRLFKLFGFLLIEWHWIGCTYWAIAVSEGFSDDEISDPWAPYDYVSSLTFGSQYIRAYFWAVMVTTGVGKDILPRTDMQYIFTTMAIVIGVLMYAVIVGSVGTALSSIDSPDSQRRRRMDAVREYLRQRGISEELTEKVLNYYDYCYTRHISQHDEAILEDIHSALKEKLDLEMNQQLLQKVPRFKQLPDGLLLVLIHSLISRIYLPNELVYMIGERANEMFFVARGDLEVLTSYGTPSTFLTDGAFFGDQLFMNNARRTDTVRCITHSELLILTKSALKKIMKLFPEFAMMVQQWSGQQKWKQLKGWERIQYAVKTAHVIGRMGSTDVRFEDVMKRLNGIDDVKNPLNKSRRRGDSGVIGQHKQVSYEHFSENYAAAFTQVHEDMEKVKRRKSKLKKATKLKKAQENGDISKLPEYDQLMKDFENEDEGQGDKITINTDRSSYSNESNESNDTLSTNS